MIDSPFSDLRGLPFYDEPISYLVLGGKPTAWEFGGWKKESMSWKTGCYIHAGLSDTEIRFTGKEVLPFFESICTNSFAKFSIGAMKHAVMCTSEGLIATHGILQRRTAMRTFSLYIFRSNPASVSSQLHSGWTAAYMVRAARSTMFIVISPIALAISRSSP